MGDVVQLLALVNTEEAQRMMSKYKFADILSDSYEALTKTPEERRNLLAVLEIISRHKDPSVVITAKIGTNLLESEKDLASYKVINNLCQFKENVDVLLSSGLLQLVRRNISVADGNEQKYLLQILKGILSHVKISK